MAHDESGQDLQGGHLVALAFDEFERLPPPLKWAGGKRWLVPHLRELWAGNENRRLVEPFVGGLAVTLGLSPKSALLNDLNPHLISFYRWLKRGLDVSSIGDERIANNRAVYAQKRNRFNELIASGKSDSEEAAVLFYYLNRTGFNGLCRFNASGFFNVPFGRYHKIQYYRPYFPGYVRELRAHTFISGDFESMRLRKSDFIYADPPYDVEFTSYSAGGFSWHDQERLAEWLAKHPGPVVASNQATDRILKLYRKHGFKYRTLDAPRRISCDGNRDDAKEMLAVKGLP